MLAATITMKPSCILRKPPPRQEISFIFGSNSTAWKTPFKVWPTSPPKKHLSNIFGKLHNLPNNNSPPPPKKKRKLTNRHQIHGY